ncbi:MAG: hypothetical protein CR974_01370 [Gammaproteobacteria bacterium]|nr:MAG: hypothetical protein CR974_01370 [Gammaproteobacteria bacterium]
MKQKIKQQSPFSPLIFLASLGAGGISVIPFAFLQYTFPHGKGLVQRAEIDFASLSFGQSILHYSLDTIMIVFALIHLLLTILYSGRLWQFVRGAAFTELFNDPTKNSAILAPFISIVMTMNVFIGPVRYFIPWIANNLQLLMLPALLLWMVIYVALLSTEMQLLKISFLRRFDINTISFGWLLHPFALGMLTVTGTGFAALAKSPDVAHTAAFLSMVSGMMGMFLLSVKLFAVFNRYFANEGLGEKATLPSFLIVIPNITLYAIALFRFGHYLERHHSMEMGAYFKLVIGGAFAFETWYLLFGLVLLTDYFKTYYFKKEYYVTQWGLICPFVAYAVLASFTFKTFLPATAFYALALVFMVIAVVFYLDLLSRHLRCRFKVSTNMQCA